MTLHGRLLRREIGERGRYGHIQGLYGDRYFVDQLDIVNELKGHTDCVNTLSWSRSGKLLASGSDDQQVNIYSYLPDNSTRQFLLKKQIQTGHTENIFSVKFMPHSNDQTIVSCAGDRQVRIFDIERSVEASSGPTLGSAGSRKVFQSHKGMVKRIVTEDSPFYFLTCSEDGEVRQWDIRQPESTYPINRHTKIPPLISYSKYGIQLHTISCSPSQPHYIALGGSHLHCFLHDRRMLGRDSVEERGQNGFSGNDEAMEKATRCVAKFAPFGQPQMTSNESRSVTACKLGQSNPNELIVSWSVDLIYSFNILKDRNNSVVQKFTTAGAESSRASRKRKRMPATDSPSTGPSIRRRAGEDVEEVEYNVSLSMRNGGSVTFPIPVRELPFSMRTDAENDDDDQIGRSDAISYAQKVRNMKNCLNKSHYSHPDAEQCEELHDIVKASALAFEKIDDYITQRTYPLTDSSSLIDYELKLRNDRAKVWRYTQASGTLARVLLQIGFSDSVLDIPARHLRYFECIRPAPREGSNPLERHEHFGYDFIKTVLLWLDSGVGAVLREFSPDSDFATTGSRRRYPVSRNAGIDTIESQLMPYLESLATDLPVVYAGHGSAGDDPRQTDELFKSEREAVRVLAREMKRTWADLKGSEERNLGQMKEQHDRRSAALKKWGWKVCFAILENTTIDVNYPFVETAFGEATMDSSAPGQRHAVNIEDVDLLGSDSEDEDEDGDDDEDLDEYDYDGVSDVPHGSERSSSSKSFAAQNVPCTSHLRRYAGHCNCETTKDVNFYGLQDEYIVSGSDGGHFFIWEKKTGRLLNILKGDCEAVNIVQPHPYEPMLAVSGIDSTIKIFSADARARQDASRAQNGISASDPRTFNILSTAYEESDYGDAEASDDDSRIALASNGSSYAHVEEDAESDTSEYEKEIIAENGLGSRKRREREYKITSKNDMIRRSEMQSQNIMSQDVYQLLATQMMRGREGNGLDEENCIVM